jgi:hypothetical protein
LVLEQWNSLNNYLWVFNCWYAYSCHVRSSNYVRSPPNPSKLQIIVHIELEECLKGGKWWNKSLSSHLKMPLCNYIGRYLFEYGFEQRKVCMNECLVTNLTLSRML